MANFALLLAAVSVALSPASALWPLPTGLQSGNSALKLASSFNIKLDVNGASQDLKDAVSRTKAYLKNDNLERLVVGRGEGDLAAVGKAKSLSSLTVTLASGLKAKSIASEAVLPLESRDDAYTLTIPSDGSAATLSANSSLGLLRGLTTFSQVWYTHSGQTYTIEAPFKIQDKPAYPYRGLMLDTARNYFPVADIKRTLDTMSWVKMNQFHWHVVDSQSFPLVVPGFTELSAKGAYSAAEVYTAKDVADVVAYANARGIDVIAEIDTPGHTAIIGEAHPDYIACKEATPWASWANEPPAGQLRLANEKVSQWTANLLTAASKLFTSSYFSTGGDEINAACYQNDTQTQADLKARGLTFEQALDSFTTANHAALKKAGKTAVVWEEMVLDHNVTISEDALVMVWISSANNKAVAQKGHKLVHAASDYFYLDCGHGGWVGDFPQGNSWCDPFKTWQKAYTFDPVANLTDTEAAFVRGGQHLLWAEQSGPENLDSTVWPRAASSAELFWTGAARPTVAEALPRLHDVSYRMRQRGTRSISLQPKWCALRPGVCDLTA